MSVIAISRGSLSAATKLAEGLSSRLGGAVITREQVLEAAERYGIAESGLEMRHIVAQHPPGFWEKYADARKHYLTCFKAALFDFVLQGPIIYHGNLAHLLLNEVPFVLRIRVNAPLEMRVEVMMAESGISRQEATRRIEAIDEERRRWTAFLYDAYAMNPMHFDIVLNLSRMTIQDGIRMIAAALENEQFRRTEEALETVRDIYLSTITEIRLMSNPDTYGLALSVTADSSAGTVTVTGHFPVGNGKTIENEIRSALSGLGLVKEIQARVKVG
jgi:cytidylate kinase